MRTKTLLSLLLLYFSSLSYAQTFDKAKMDSLFTQIESNDKGMGSISLFYDGQEIYQRSYGYADIENNVKANSTTKYRVGSISKTFTSTIIMKLVEESKLSLSSKLSEFYPQIKNSDKITIEHLLQHRSGISNFMAVSDYKQWHTDKHTKSQLLDRIVSSGITFEPDEKFEYSNSNFVLLTFIAEDVTHEKFADLLNKMIIYPCDLKNTYPSEEINAQKNEAYSYIKLNGWAKQPETDMSIALGAGFIVSTPTDLNFFLSNLFSGKIINTESLKRMTTLKDNFGLGLFKVPFYEMTGYGHTGGIDGFQSNAYYFPKSKVAIALTENGVDYPLNDIVVGVLSIYFEREYSIPEFSKEIILKSEDLDKYLGVYSSPNLPIKLTITKEGNTLIAQGTGQPAFGLEGFAEDKFRFDSAKLELEFIPDENRMILKQYGATFDMTREN